MIVGLRDLVGDIQKRLVGSADLDQIEFLCLYSGSPLPEGSKSVSFRPTVAVPDRTLSSEEVGVIRGRIIGHP